ncbi:MAG TPA: SRPBCC family protein [Caulobacteraceae bacterium]|nr:SRPBCC family protein [Caulobacteraceae bacterium]
MNAPSTLDHDLRISRLIKAPRQAIWRAWTDPRAFEQWWLPKPYLCRVIEMQVRPGGALRTQMSEDGVAFAPHMDACFLEAAPLERIVFTNALSAGWRPVGEPYPVPITAIITLTEAAGGTEYACLVLHKNAADAKQHLDMGFHDGWGTVIDQLTGLVEG